jgi:predicted XRE-type DNA-binding protein
MAKNVVRSSENIFADLGFEDAEEHMLKARLVMLISDQIRHRGLKQEPAAKLVGLHQSDISRMLKGRFEKMSLERLLRVAKTLGRDIAITFPEPPKCAARERSGHILIEGVAA